MKPATLPLCCSTEAFKLLSQQVRSIDSPDALINGAIGVKSMQELIERTSAEPPGVNKLDAVSAWSTWLQGKSEGAGAGRLIVEAGTRHSFRKL